MKDNNRNYQELKTAVNNSRFETYSKDNSFLQREAEFERLNARNNTKSLVSNSFKSTRFLMSAILAFLLALFFFGKAIIYNKLNKNEVKNCTTSVTAVYSDEELIISQNTDPEAIEENQTAYYYTYTYEGKEYQATFMRIAGDAKPGNKGKPYLGKEITILIDPDHPEKNYMPGDQRSVKGFVGLGSGLTVMAVIFGFLYKKEIF